MEEKNLQKLLDKSFSFQKMIFYGMGVFTALAGIVILILSIKVPPKPGEEQIVQILQITSVGFIFFCGWCFWYVKRRIEKVVTLLNNPTRIEKIVPVKVSRKGVVAFGIRVYPKNGKMVGFNVTDSNTQKKIMDILQKRVNTS